MNLFGFLSGGVDKVVDSVGNAIDSLVTSDEEKLILKNELVKIQAKAKVDAMHDAQANEAEISKRWLSDNEHMITRLVRPVSYASMLIMFIAIVISDGNIGQFTIDKAYIPVIETLLVTMTLAYFGSRGAEKVTKILGK